MVKNPPARARDSRDTGLIPGLERSPGEGNVNPLQYFLPGDPMDRGVLRHPWGLKESGSTGQLN